MSTMAGSSVDCPEKAHRHPNLRQYRPSHVGRHPVLQKVSLGFGLIGLIIPLGSEPEKRVDELLDVMADAVPDFDVVPLGMMEKIRENVCMSGIMLENPEIDRFDVAVPLRKADQRRNYFHWNSDEIDWNIRHINFKDLKIQCGTAMLIVKEKTQPGKQEKMA